MDTPLSETAEFLTRTAPAREEVLYRVIVPLYPDVPCRFKTPEDAEIKISLELVTPCQKVPANPETRRLWV
jgi:hypothetical protein